MRRWRPRRAPPRARRRAARGCGPRPGRRSRCWRCALHRRQRLMRTAETLDDDVYEASMSLARGSGKPLGTVLSGMARDVFERLPTIKRRRARSPTFDVHRDARMITASRIQDGLDDEGAA